VVVRSPELCDRRVSRLVLIDLQERLLSAIPAAPRLVADVAALATAAQTLGIPIDITEQVPQKLGPTDPALQAFAATRIEKQRFSAAPDLNWGSALEQPAGRDQIILAGVETHVCVLQTAFDLLSLGYRVTIPADAVASRREVDHAAALKRLRDVGATVTTWEAVVFEWLETAADPAFKTISHLVKQRAG
jgi:nicotinamidase-related amidase